MQVLTYNGIKKDKTECRLISGVYYIVGDRTVMDSGDCFKMRNGRYATLANGNIEWDYTLKEYNFKTQMIEGYVSKNKKGYFSSSKGELCVVESKNVVKYPYTNFEPDYDIYSGNYYLGDLITLRKYVRKAPNEKMYAGFDQKSIYNYRDLPREILKEIDKESSIEKPRLELENEIIEGLMNLSIGVEIETSWCNLPEENLYKYGFFPVRDGSIAGNEFVSSPAFDINGIRNIYYFMDECNKTAQVDSSTSFHVHVGSIKVKDEKKFLVDLYNNYYTLQNEINQLVPFYKRDFFWLRNKNKDHCKQLAYPVTNFDQVFSWANEFCKSSKNCNYENKTHVKQGRPKYEWESRYYALNYSNFIFNDQKTIEFRYHHGILNPNRGLNWILIVAAIVNATIHELKFSTLEEVIKYCYPTKLAKRLNSYISFTKEENIKNYYENLDIYSVFTKEGIQF